MAKHAQPEKPAHPYRPEPIGAEREDNESDKDQDIDNENSNLNRLEPDRRCRENSEARDTREPVGGSPYSFRPTASHEGVDAAEDQKRDE